MSWNAFKDANGDWAVEELFAVPSAIAGVVGYFVYCFRDGGHAFDILQFMAGVSAGALAIAGAKRARGDTAIDTARAKQGAPQ